MREKRVSLVVLTCSLIVATCASASVSLVTSHYFHKYVAVIPLLLSGQIATVSPATVWIPEEEAVDTSGSVQDEFSEVAHVFARPENRVVRPKEEDELTHLPVPWTSLKNEYQIYQKIQESKRKPPEEKRKKKVSSVEEEDNSSEEEDDAEEDEEDDDEEEEDEPEGRAAAPPPPPMTIVKAEPQRDFKERKSGGSGTKNGKTGKKEPIPLAFYGQQNHDDDEKDFIKDEANIFKKKRKNGSSKQKKKEDEEEDDDVSASQEGAASLEDYADYAQDDDDEEDESSEKKKQGNNLSFEDIPLAIREMIINDLANQNQNNGSYHPNLTPQVTGGSTNYNKLPQRKNKGSNSASVEDDDGSKEENSSEEEEDDNNAAEVLQIPNLGGLEPTPPAIRPTPKPKKGDDDEDIPYGEEEEDGKGKSKGKGKGKKGKNKKKGKGWGGWGQLHVHHPGGWGGGHKAHHHHEDKGWGWDPEKHDGLLEQLVRGSTWERVLKYYHWKRDQQKKEESHLQDPDLPHNVHTHSHPPHHEEHPGHELSHGVPEGWGWDQEEGKIKKLVKKAFKGSFWERAVHTYAKYKENQAKNPKKPTLVDLDSDHIKFSR